MRFVSGITLGLALIASARADVLVVDAAGGGGYVDLQAAVDAAQDGDVLLVRSGVYAAPSIVARALTLVADAGAIVRVDGTTDVGATSAGQLVLLSGLRLRGPEFAPALRLTACAGPVRLQDCVITGAAGPAFLGADDAPERFAAGPGACVHACDDVAFVGCALTGGAGGEHLPASAPGAVAGTGRDALEASAAVLTLYRSRLAGGAGGAAMHGGFGGTAGAGTSHFGLESIAVRCLLEGGAGGHGTAGPGACSAGAPGLRVAGTTASEFGCTFAGGVGGGAPNGDCASGADVEGQVTSLVGAQRGLSITRVARAGHPARLDLCGVPGDAASVFRARETARAARLEAGGAWLLAGLPPRPSTPVGDVPGAGSMSVWLPLPDVPPGAARLVFLQALFQPSGGAPALSNPAVVVVLGGGL